MITPELLNFVRVQISRGVSKEEIERDLSSQGWSIEDIQEAFQSTNPPLTNAQKILSNDQYTQDSMPNIQTQTSVDDNLVYATFLRRFVAYLIDMFIISVLSSLLLNFIISPIIFPLVNNIVANMITNGPTGVSFQGLASIFSTLFKVWGVTLVVGLTVGLIVYLIYYTFFYSSRLQATPGKMILGLRVVGKDGNSISIFRSVGRTAASILSAIIFYIGYLFPLFTEKKQALHDIIASTVVVDVKRKTKLFVFLCFFALLVFLIAYGKVTNPSKPITSVKVTETSTRSQPTLSDAKKEEIRSAVVELHNVVKLNSISEMRKYLVSSVESQLEKSDAESSADSYVESVISKYSAVLETINENTLMDSNTFWMPFFGQTTDEPTMVVVGDKSAEAKGKIVRLSFKKIDGMWKSQVIY